MFLTSGVFHFRNVVCDCSSLLLFAKLFAKWVDDTASILFIPLCGIALMQGMGTRGVRDTTSVSLEDVILIFSDAPQDTCISYFQESFEFVSSFHYLVSS